MPKALSPNAPWTTSSSLKTENCSPRPWRLGALYGITRQTVIELAVQNGLKVTEPNLTRYDLYTADECFLTGTGAEIMLPVIKIDEAASLGPANPASLRKSSLKSIAP